MAIPKLGGFQIDARCRWDGQAVLHAVKGCDCEVPDHYVNVWPDGTVFNAYEVAIVRERIGYADAKTKLVTRVRTKFRVCCSKCGKTFATQDGCEDHLKRKHNITIDPRRETFAKIIERIAPK